MNSPPPADKLRSHAAELASMAKGLADENRLRILLSLAGGPKAVSRVVEEIGLSQPLVSHHLKELRRAGLVQVERRGPFIYYEMAGPQLLEVLATLLELGRPETRKADKG